MIWRAKLHLHNAIWLACEFFSNINCPTFQLLKLAHPCADRCHNMQQYHIINRPNTDYQFRHDYSQNYLANNNFEYGFRDLMIYVKLFIKMSNILQDIATFRHCKLIQNADINYLTHLYICPFPYSNPLHLLHSYKPPSVSSISPLLHYSVKSCNVPSHIDQLLYLPPKDI